MIPNQKRVRFRFKCEEKLSSNQTQSCTISAMAGVRNGTEHYYRVLKNHSDKRRTFAQRKHRALLSEDNQGGVCLGAAVGWLREQDQQAGI